MTQEVGKGMVRNQQRSRKRQRPMERPCSRHHGGQWAMMPANAHLDLEWGAVVKWLRLRLSIEWSDVRGAP